ncbi:uncharacterized protein LOC143282838 [Babylonia areolata]|uniref:uncharacterized protein LOC143282838 n=1 Tax=Babylonia areolata TaxID=304850 RepID=UPI003FD4E801
MLKEGEEGEVEGEVEGEKRKKVGHYVLGSCLGEGSFAKVRVGTHILSREKVAVKVVSKRLIVRREAARRNFRREALLLQHVRHPHVVRLLEAMETAHSYYLVFELASQGNLLAYLTARKCLKEGEARRFMRQIVSAVDHLHRSSIVHRDLKLENCLLSATWDIKIIDFGLSALCQRESGLHTQCGSPAYAAPEIFGNRRYGPAVDLWSIGVCLYAMVVGRLPFLPHPPTNLPQLHALILKGPVIPVFLSTGLQQLLSGLLEVQESRRLSITDTLNQSWLTCQHSQPIARFPPVSQAPPPDVDTDVVRYMSGVFRFSQSDVIHSVTERKLNAASATYHLLKRHMEGERNAAAVAAADGEGPPRKEEGRERGGGVGGVEWSGGGEEAAARRSVVSEYGMGAGAGMGSGECGGQTTGRFTVSEYGGGREGAEGGSCGVGGGGGGSGGGVGRRVLVSEYVRPLAPCSDGQSGCPVLRSHVLSSHLHSPAAASASSASGERGGEAGRRMGKGGEGVRDYKQCILYLKEARHAAFALGARSLLPHLLHHPPPPSSQHLTTASSSSPRLPFLHRPPPPPPPHHPHYPTVHGGGSTEGHQCHHQQGSGVGGQGGQEVKLNVLGRPALLERGGKGAGAGVGDKGDNSISYPSSALALASQSHLSLSSQDGGGGGGGGARPPPPPPNTAQGMRMTTAGAQHPTSSEPGSSRPCSPGSGVSQWSLSDPWGPDTWRTGLQPRLPLAGHAHGHDRDGGGRKSRGVAYVAPLTSPKALTTREGAAAAKEAASGPSTRQNNYFLVRQLTADLNRRRVAATAGSNNSSSNKKVTTTPHPAPALPAPRRQPPPSQPPPPQHSADSGSVDRMVSPVSSVGGGEAGGYGGDSTLDTERFLTPVIRVTITSTAKH